MPYSIQQNFNTNSSHAPIFMMGAAASLLDVEGNAELSEAIKAEYERLKVEVKPHMSFFFSVST